MADNTDCNDGNGGINPSSTESFNGLDDDCSGSPEGISNTWTGVGDGVNWSDAVGRTLHVSLNGQIQVLGTILIQD